jgi:hypothetical protein
MIAKDKRMPMKGMLQSKFMLCASRCGASPVTAKAAELEKKNRGNSILLSDINHSFLLPTSIAVYHSPFNREMPGFKFFSVI